MTTATAAPRSLDAIQREMWSAVRQPLTAEEKMREVAADGSSLRATAERIIKPNDRLTSFERLEIYNRQYWWRILSALAEDFPGVRAVCGDALWDEIAVAYLERNPSRSFTLRDLGSRFPQWLVEHQAMLPERRRELAIEMARLEWAEIEAFDEAELPRLSAEAFAAIANDDAGRLKLQPYLRLVESAYPVDDLLLRIRKRQASDHDRASNAFDETDARREPKQPKLAVPRRRHALIAVHRQENSVYYRRLEAEEFAALKAIGDGAPLSEALAVLAGMDPAKAAKKVESWFANWASLGWLAA